MGMGNRRSLTPTGSTDGEVHATRRVLGGARREIADRVVVRLGDTELAGWALNVSRGGIRLIIEGVVELGQTYELAIGSEVGTRRGRIVWLQEERDGMVVGVEFTDSRPPLAPGGGPTKS